MGELREALKGGKNFKDIEVGKFSVEGQRQTRLRREPENKVLDWLGVHHVESCHIDQEREENHSIGREVVVDQRQMQDDLQRIQHAPQVLE